MFEIVVVYLSISMPVCLHLSVLSMLLCQYLLSGCACHSICVYLSCLIVCLFYLCQAVSVRLSVRLYPSVGCANVCLYQSRSVCPCISIRCCLSSTPYIFCALVNEVNTSPSYLSSHEMQMVPKTPGEYGITREGAREANRQTSCVHSGPMPLKPSVFRYLGPIGGGRKVRG